MKTPLTLSTIVAGLLLTACGSTDSTTETPTSTGAPTSTIMGTVPGTLIEAFCEDGSYYHVNSVHNDTSEHPFSIEIPTDITCRLVMTTNEHDESIKVVTPIGLVTDVSSTTTFRANSKLIDLGHIDLPMDRSEINDSTGDGVSDDILMVSTPEGTIIAIELENDPMDHDGDGIPNIYEDDDSDGINNYDDSDDDDDGIEDDLDEDYAGTMDYFRGGVKKSADNDDKEDAKDRDDDSDDDDEDKEDAKDRDDDSDDDDEDKEDAKDRDDDSDDDDEDKEDAKDRDDGDTSTTTPIVTLPTGYTPDQGRLLGSHCAQCHGTNGVSTNSWDSIAGEDDLLDEIHDDDPIMRAQADGYTTNEIQAIGEWLKTLRK